MSTFEDDWIGFPHIVGILDVLKTVNQERQIPAVCTSQVLAGDTIALDYVFATEDCDSMAWCRIAGAFPSLTFPNQDGGPTRVITLATQIELGLVRSVEIPDNAEALSAEEQYEYARLAAADMGAMLEAICRYCTVNEVPLLVGNFAPLGPQGAVLGGTWSATLGGV